MEYPEPIEGACSGSVSEAAAPLLEIAELRTHFFTASGVVRAVDGVSYAVRSGETLGVVGESGCGKSVTALSVLRLVADPPGRIVGGAIHFAGVNLLELSESEMEDIRGNAISMIFQEPMTSLNPLMTIGRQISEAVALHQGVGRREAMDRAIEALRRVHIPEPERRVLRLPAPAVGRNAAARDDRDGAVVQPEAADRRRADNRPRRDDPGADPRSDARIAGDIRHRDHSDHARHGSGGGERRPCRCHVRRAQGRGGGCRRPVRLPRAPLYGGAARFAAESGKGGAHRHEAGPAHRDQGIGSLTGTAPARMQFCAALRLCDRAVPSRVPATRRAPSRPLGCVLARRPPARRRHARERR